METAVIAVSSIGIGFLQGIVIFILSGMKKDQADMWERMNSHYHEASCENENCKKLRTGNVIIPRGGH